MRYQMFVNPHTGPLPPVPTGRPAGWSPLRFHQGMPGYEPTPLRDCPALAERLGVGAVLVKDEATRMGLPSFKILGASWAAVTAVARHWTGGSSAPPTLRDLAQRIPDPDKRRLVAATDGNHGRGVARMARLLGVGCEILVPAGTATARIAAITGEGAVVRVVEGSYDDAVAASAALADEFTLVVSDTSWPGYRETPAAVIDGYSTMFAEIDATLDRAGLPAPDVVCLQAGVGAFAAAGLRHFRGPDRAVPASRTVVVEPSGANCLLASARAGRLTGVPGPHLSTMAGLNCGLPSELAWPVVRAGTDVFVAVDDDAAYEAMRELARHGIVAGESGAAGLAGLLAVIHGPNRDRLGLTPGARVLIVNTEGATDPRHYREVVGRAPARSDGGG
jgi:diaminopropionate ammonia-lyase